MLASRPDLNAEQLARTRSLMDVAVSAPWNRYESCFDESRGVAQPLFSGESSRSTPTGQDLHRRLRASVRGCLNTPRNPPTAPAFPMTDDDSRPALRALLASQRYAVLATDDRGQPFTSLMAFAASDDLNRLVVLTERGTRKFANLQTNPRVALLIDERGNRGSDTEDAVALTVIGRAREAGAVARSELLPRYLARHPQLADFAASTSCAVVELQVASFLLVSRARHVAQWHPPALRSSAPRDD